MREWWREGGCEEGRVLDRIRGTEEERVLRGARWLGRKEAEKEVVWDK